MPVLRFVRIVYEALRFALAGLLRRLRLSRSHARAPERFCLGLARRGTTFIKFGQLLSLRRDLLRDDYVAALQSLQDHIAPFPAKDAIREIERGLGRAVSQIFAELDHKPRPPLRSRRFIRPVSVTDGT